jgi:hypothetical protein
MALMRVMVTLHTTDANPANYVTNTMYWDDGEVEAYSALVDEIVDAYNGLSAYWSSLIALTGHEIQFYRVSDPEPRAPVFVDSFNLSSVSSSAIPREVALCCSFQAPRISGVPQSRRRGRCYLGPFGSTAINTTTGNPATGLITAVVGWGDALLEFSKGQADWKWAVYSTVDDTGSEISDGWVDNSFDTQRRRGNEWTTRTLFS